MTTPTTQGPAPARIATTTTTTATPRPKSSPASAPSSSPSPSPSPSSGANPSSESVADTLPAAATVTASTATTTTSRPSPALASAKPTQAKAQAQAQPTGAPRRGARNATTPDPLSDRATAFLIRRILCSQQLDKGKSTSASIEGLLPPLTSRNDVDLQLYALIAIILRDNVQTWYSKITPDETFVAEIVQIIAHCTRALEQRLRKVDLESLLLDELPDLLDRHVTAYRAANDPITQPPVETSPREIYHSLCPLPALSPVPHPGSPESVAEQAENEVAYRQLLVHAVLAVLLPTEDLENGCLTALVGQILSELIIGNVVANRLSEPWLIWELFQIAAGVIERRRAAPGGQDPPAETQSSRASVGGQTGFSVQAIFWTILQWCFLATSFMRIIFNVLVASRSLPPRASRGMHVHQEVTSPTTGKEHMQQQHPRELSETDPGPTKTPVLAFRCWSAISNLIEMDVRMPWICGALSMLQWVTMSKPGRVAGVDGTIDRLLSDGIHRYLLDPGLLPPLLRNVRGALFPNNMPGTSTLKAPSSDAELRALRRRCARALWALVPRQPLARRLCLGGAGAGAGSGLTEEPTHEAGGATLLDKGDEQQQQQLLRSAPKNGAGGNGGGGNGQELDDRSDLLQHDAGHKQDEQQEENNADPLGGAPAVDDERILAEIETAILDLFSDAYCNKHLVYSIIELVLVRLMPELAEKGVVGLWAERLPILV
ncbi:PXA domain-containing protein [Podospora appendiculata]|uniref:PXA domain-containing protein n=1 Tax=Podospora appendiculata TaxID=314037 RepID=A0AAE0XG33_9PEZI|nr:PXA domain-containing protein [Podospora appendiculata]